VNPIDKLIKAYKLETRKGIMKAKTRNLIWTIALWVGLILIYGIGLAAVTVAASLSVLWITGVNVPFWLDLIVTYLVLFSVGPTHRSKVASAIWITFAILLLFWYAGATPLIHR
jgi:hypothetical protein